jgi:heme oxygenase
MSGESILDALKSETRLLHAQLESHVDVLSRLQNLQAYQQLLAAFYGFYSPVESKLAACHELQAAASDLGSRRKVPLLVSDLRLLSVAVETLPLAADVPGISSAAEGFGCLYVLEGATLGSQIIKRLLLQQLGISTENGGAFFNAYGDRVGDMWQGFRQTLSEFSSTHPQQRDVIIAAAKDTFLKFDAWFLHCLG